MCRFLSPLLFCLFVTLMVCETAYAQRDIPNQIIQTYQAVFEEADADSNGKLSPRELQNVFKLLGSRGTEVQQVVAEKFANKDEGIELVDLLHAYAIYAQRAQEAARERDRQIDALQTHVRERMQQEAPREAQEEPAEEASPAVAEEVADVHEAVEVEKAETEAVQASESLTLKFEIVLLERATREAPARTLAEEVLEVATKGQANNSTLAARIAPLLSSEPNRVTRLVDYFQASTLAGNEVMLQKGTRPNRGQNQGTLVKIVPLAGEGASVEVSMTFEKSFFAPADFPAPEEDKVAEEEGEASEAAMKKAEEAFLAQLSERERQFLSQLRQREGRPSTESGGQSSPDIETLTAQGSLALTPGQPAVFSEMAGRSENGFREYVILIELTRP